MSDQCSSDIATIACDLNDNPTTAQLLLALAAAWRCGHDRGFVDGSTMATATIDRVQQAIAGPRAKVLADAEHDGAAAKALP
ncbi:MAG: hypothetical protein ACRESS_12395 [Stenotrophobium sp.]